jgi:hypothetical protein
MTRGTVYGSPTITPIIRVAVATLVPKSIAAQLFTPWVGVDKPPVQVAYETNARLADMGVTR